MAKKGSDLPESENTDTGTIESLRNYLKELDQTQAALKAGKIGVEEAKQRLQEIAEKQAQLTGADTAEESSELIEEERRTGREVAEPPEPEDESVQNKGGEPDEAASGSAEDETANPVGETGGDPGPDASRQSGNESALFEGECELTMVPPVDRWQFGEFRKLLNRVENLNIVVLTGSVGKATTIRVSLTEPLPLPDILRAMTPVDRVDNADGLIRVTLHN